MNTYIIYDSIAEVYMTNFMFNARNHAEAIREFIGSGENPSLPFGRHPADFHLFHIGSINPMDAKIAPVDAKVNIGSLLDLDASRRSSEAMPLITEEN